MNEFNNDMVERNPVDDEQYFCRFTFGQFFALLVIEVVALFFSFYLGARYGKKLLGLEETFANKESSLVVTTADPDVQRMADDLVKKAGTPVLREKIARMLEDAARQREDTANNMPEIITEAPAAAPVAQQQGSDSYQAQPTDDIAAVTAAASAPPERRKNVQAESFDEDATLEEIRRKAAADNQAAANPSSDSPSEVVRVKSSDHARYSIQVGSYNVVKEAEGAVDKWKKQGYPAYLMIADIEGRGTWYRVRIGGFPTKVEADNYLQSELKGTDAVVVLNEK